MHIVQCHSIMSNMPYVKWCKLKGFLHSAVYYLNVFVVIAVVIETTRLAINKNSPTYNNNIWLFFQHLTDFNARDVVKCSPTNTTAINISSTRGAWIRATGSSPASCATGKKLFIYNWLQMYDFTAISKKNCVRRSRISTFGTSDIWKNLEIRSALA